MVWVSCTVYYGLYGHWLAVVISGVMAALSVLAAYFAWTEHKPRRAVKIGNRIYKPKRPYANAEGIQQWFLDEEACRKKKTIYC